MKRNVLHLINSFHLGGTERQAVQLVRLLHGSNRFQLHVATLSNEGGLRDEVLGLGITDIPEFPLTSFYNRNALAQLRRFAKFLREREIDVVHTHDFYTNIFGMAGGRLAGVRARIASRRETGGMRSVWQKRTERAAYNLAHHIIANAEAVRAQLIAEGVRAEKTTVIYNGLDMERIARGENQNMSREAMLAALNLPGDANGKARKFVTIVANLRHEVKDHGTFLRAARRVRDKVPEAAFVLAGEGELTESIRGLAADLGLAADVFFTGRCERVPLLLRASDVCVLSSKAEGFSNSILEYMAAARAVVATDVGGAREAIIEGETGYIVTAGDDEQLAGRIISLLLDPNKAREMGRRGRGVVEAKFSCAAQLARTEELYERLLTQAHAPVALTRETTKSIGREESV